MNGNIANDGTYNISTNMTTMVLNLDNYSLLLFPSENQMIDRNNETKYDNNVAHLLLLERYFNSIENSVLLETD